MKKVNVNGRLVFLVEHPLSKKNRMRYGGGRVYKDRRIEAFEGEVFIKSHNAVVENGWRQTKNAVSVTIQYRLKDDTAWVMVEDLWHPRSKRRKDLGNLGDVILDVMQRSGVYFDDRQVERYVVQEFFE